MSSKDLAPRVPFLVALAALGAIALNAQQPSKFYPDDPIAADNDRALDAGGAQEVEASDYYDFLENTFMTPGEQRDMPAANVNTLDEAPDSAWFTNRIGQRPMTIDEIVRGPDRMATLSIDGWPIVEGKNEGLQPGWRVADPAGHLYQIEFDPPSNPEMATGAELVGTLFYHAFGYNVVDVYLVEVDPGRHPIAPSATIRDIGGRERRLNRADIDDVLRKAARRADGKYRALASRFADGVPLGSFRYYGTRPDDPNDIFPHEHRRELRANRVFAAWLNHDDSRGINSLDMLEGHKGRQFVRHYMFDFGSILGSGTAFAQSPRASNEYILDWKEGFLTLATLGLYPRKWLLIDYPNVSPAVGRFEADAFNPEQWKPEYPNPAFRNMRDDDAYWGARIVAQFSEEAIRAIVAKGRYSDPRAAEYIVKTLMQRREKVLRTWLTRVLPIERVRLDPSGGVTFENTAVKAGISEPPEHYLLTWWRFDNRTGVHEQVTEEAPTATAEGRLPPELAKEEYVALTVRGVHRHYPRWLRPARVYFRRTPQGWQTVGLERYHDRMPGR
jgi:hypothetical protein